MATSYEEIPIDTADEFISYLRPSNKQWVSKDNNWNLGWIFRGHRLACCWKLIPSAWRSSNIVGEFTLIDKVKKILANRTPNWKTLGHFILEHHISDIFDNPDHSKVDRSTLEANLSSLMHQIKAEVEIRSEFLRLSDEMGYSILAEDVRYINYSENWSYWITKYYHNPQPNTLNFGEFTHRTTALAQHYGMPTRLLDWTFNPLMAAWFALPDITDNGISTCPYCRKSQPHIAVWALNKDATGSDKSKPIQLITVPRADISYLNAQEGCFTHEPHANDFYFRNGKWPQLDEYIEQLGQHDCLQKITLPYSEVNELKRLLFLERIHEARLKPSYGSVTNVLKANWEQLSDNI